MICGHGDRAGRSQQALRIWRVIVLLRRQRCTLQGIAAHCGVSTRTIRRDLATIEAIPLPLRVRLGDLTEGEETIYYLGEVPEWPRNETTPTRNLTPLSM